MMIQPRLRKLCLPVLPILIAAACFPWAHAQPPSNIPFVVTPEQEALAKTITFEVATFKVNITNQPHAELSFPPGGDGFTMKNRPMRDLIRYTYAVESGPSFHFSKQPAWLDETRWDIQAKVAEADIPAWQKLSTEAQKIALRKFLADYLKLTFHTDTTPYTYYNLVVDKHGPKMKPYTPNDTFTTPRGLPIPPHNLLYSGPSEFTGHGATMAQLVGVLSGHSPHIVHDQTGLTGLYNFVLTFAPDIGSDPRGAYGEADTSTSSAPSLFTAVEQQLGLKLVPVKGPLEGIVIDHIEQPPEN